MSSCLCPPPSQVHQPPLHACGCLQPHASSQAHVPTGFPTRLSIKSHPPPVAPRFNLKPHALLILIGPHACTSTLLCMSTCPPVSAAALRPREPCPHRAMPAMHATHPAHAAIHHRASPPSRLVSRHHHQHPGPHRPVSLATFPRILIVRGHPVVHNLC